jgi:hypothetical protein
MASGLSAREAIKIASKYDRLTGSSVTSMTI